MFGKAFPCAAVLRFTLYALRLKDPRQPGWRRPSLGRMAALIRAQGLDGPFWALPGTGDDQH